jgi:hypothetical protein
LSEQHENERQRQIRAKLVRAFDRRVWQPNERPQLGSRLLAGGAALIVAAGAVFGLGALTSYSHRKATEQRRREAALAARDRSASQTAHPTQVPTTKSISPTVVTPRKAAPLSHSVTHSPHPAAPRKLRKLASGPITGPGPTRMCVDVDTNTPTSGNAVQLWNCNSGTTGQQWTVASDGTLRAFGKCLDIVGDGTANFTKVQLWDCAPGVGGQQWRVRADGSLFNPQSGRCLDDPQAKTDKGTQLQIYRCNGLWTQQWKVGG